MGCWQYDGGKRSLLMNDMVEARWAVFMLAWCHGHCGILEIVQTTRARSQFRGSILIRDICYQVYAIGDAFDGGLGRACRPGGLSCILGMSITCRRLRTR